MSSMRNAVHRRQHRERGQLEGREKWGLLEKHKDYSLRAKDYNAKQAKLQRLREKARDRNPDEFAFGMLSAQKGQQGKHGAREGTSLSQDTVKLLKTQDAGYLRTVGERIRREMERLEKEVQLQDGMEKVLGGTTTTTANNKRRSSEDDDDDEADEDEDMLDMGVKRRKFVFVESREDQKELGRELDEDDDEEDEDEQDETFGTQLQNHQQRKPTKKEIEAQRKALTEARAARKLKRRAAEARRNKLAILKKQYAEITTAERELDLQRAKMSNSLGGVNKNGIKWKIRERKR